MVDVGTWKTLATRDRDNEDGWPGRLAFCPDSSTIVTAYARDRYQLLRATDLEPLAILDAPKTNSVGPVCFTSDGSQLEICYHGEIYVWDLPCLQRQLSQIGLNRGGINEVLATYR
jgi:WD40 repeat protein